jgi:hypothetical protein
MVGEPVSVDENAQDNVLAYALLYRSRFPTVDHGWLRAGRRADIGRSLSALGELIDELRALDAS